MQNIPRTGSSSGTCWMKTCKRQITQSVTKLFQGSKCQLCPKPDCSTKRTNHLPLTEGDDMHPVGRRSTWKRHSSQCVGQLWIHEWLQSRSFQWPASVILCSDEDSQLLAVCTVYTVGRMVQTWPYLHRKYGLDADAVTWACEQKNLSNMQNPCLLRQNCPACKPTAPEDSNMFKVTEHYMSVTISSILTNQLYSGWI